MRPSVRVCVPVRVCVKGNWGISVSTHTVIILNNIQSQQPLVSGPLVVARSSLSGGMAN